MKQENKGILPPYLPFKTFRSGLEALQVALPEILDRSVWKTQSGGAQNSLLQAFKFFGLIDGDNRVQEELRTLVTDQEDRPRRIRILLDRSYPAVVALGKSNGTVPQLNNAMEQLGIRGDTLRKGITFFLQAADYAQLPLSPLWPTPGERDRKAGVRVNGAPRSVSTRTRTPSGGRGTTSRNRGGGGGGGSGTGTGGGGGQAGSTHTVKLERGGTVVLIVSVDFVAVSPSERQWLLELIDKFNEHGSRKMAQETSARETA